MYPMGKLRWKPMRVSVLVDRGVMEKASFGTSVALIHMGMYVLDRSVLDMKTGPRCGKASTICRRICGSVRPNCIASSGTNHTTASLRPLKV